MPSVSLWIWGELNFHIQDHVPNGPAVILPDLRAVGLGVSPVLANLCVCMWQVNGCAWW